MASISCRWLVKGYVTPLRDQKTFFRCFKQVRVARYKQVQRVGDLTKGMLPGQEEPVGPVKGAFGQQFLNGPSIRNNFTIISFK